ncbi:MAG: NUDIX hydrolase [Pseudomonadota bacterium]
MRRYGTPPRRGIRYTDRPGAYAVIRHGEGLLLTEQARPVLEVQLPGGGIDPGEGPVQALHREVLEETGWRVRVLRRLGAYCRFAYMPEYDLWARKIAHIYLCTPTLRLGPPSEPDHRALWLPEAQAIPAITATGDAAFAAAGLRISR